MSDTGQRQPEQDAPQAALAASQAENAELREMINAPLRCFACASATAIPTSLMATTDGPRPFCAECRVAWLATLHGALAETRCSECVAVGVRSFSDGGGLCDEHEPEAQKTARRVAALLGIGAALEDATLTLPESLSMCLAKFVDLAVAGQYPLSVVVDAVSQAYAGVQTASNEGVTNGQTEKR